MDFNADLCRAICGGGDLDIPGFVRQILDGLKLDDPLLRVGYLARIPDRSNDPSVDYELLRLLEEGINGNTPDAEIKNIVLCLEHRKIRVSLDELTFDYEKNIEIGNRMKELAVLLESRDDKSLFDGLMAASGKRCNLEKEIEPMLQLFEEMDKAKGCLRGYPRTLR